VIRISKQLYGLVFAVILVLSCEANAQQRTFGAQALSLDDGARHTITLQTPSVPTSYTITLPSAPPPVGLYSVLWSDATGATNWVRDVAIVQNALPNLTCPVNIATNAAAGCTITIGSPGSTTVFNGTTVLTTAPTIPLQKDNIWVGNAANQQAAIAPGSNGQVLTIVGTTPTWANGPPNSIPGSRIATAGTITQVIADTHVTATSRIMLQFEDPTGATIISTNIISRVTGVSFTVQYAGIPGPGTFVSYMIMP
jgi:hypothetical protein